MRPIPSLLTAAVSLIVAFLPLHQSAAQASADDALIAKIDALAAKEVANPGAAGLSIAVARGDRVILNKGYGKADLEHDAPASETSAFRIASVTKQFTAAAIMRLTEQGKLSLDDDFTKYIDYPVPQGKTITIRQLLNHTSGIKNYTDLPDFFDNVGRDLPPEKVLDPVRNLPLDFEPGTKWAYSNTGYHLLGMVIEKVIGVPYAKHMQDEFFTPLHLAHTRYDNGAEVIPGRARGYGVIHRNERGSGRDGTPVNASYLSMTIPYAAGGLLSTAGDLVKWQLALVGGKVVSLDSYKQMTTPARLSDGSEARYGFGLFMDEIDGHPNFMHQGGIPGFSSILVYFTNEKLSIAVISNSPAASSGRLAAEIAREAFATKTAPTAAGRSAPPYVIVVDRSPAATGYEKAAEELAAWRTPSVVVDLNNGDLDAAFERIGALGPKHVAFVVAPERIDDNFVGHVFERATRLDDAPDLDVAIGYITGATANDAVAMVRLTRKAETDRASVSKKFVAIGHTFREADLGLFAIQQRAHLQTYGFESAAINPIDESKDWETAKAQEMRKLDGASLVFLAGHGMGDWCCGVDARDYEGFRLDRAIVVNGACHSASMLKRHDISAQTGGIKPVAIPAERSICLKLIRAGAIAQLGSTASSSWMNVGPAIPRFFNEGRTMGESLQITLNAHIEQQGIRSVDVIDFIEGEPSPQFLAPDRNPGHIQSVSRLVLIGDPAFRPMAAPIESKPYPEVAERPHPMGDKAGAPAAGVAQGNLDAARNKTIEQLVAELDRDVADGFVALNETIRRGDAAVLLLIQQLATTRGWQVPKALGALADERAIDPLILALDRVPTPPFSDVVVESLELITGAKAGTTANQWKAWRSRQDAAAQPGR